MSKKEFKDKHEEYLAMKVRCLEYELLTARWNLKYWKERGWRKDWEGVGRETKGTE